MKNDEKFIASYLQIRRFFQLKSIVFFLISPQKNIFVRYSLEATCQDAANE